MRQIKTYIYDTNIEDINPGKMYDNVNILSPVIYLCIIYCGMNTRYIIGYAHRPWRYFISVVHVNFFMSK